MIGAHNCPAFRHDVCLSRRRSDVMSNKSHSDVINCVIVTRHKKSQIRLGTQHLLLLLCLLPVLVVTSNPDPQPQTFTASITDGSQSNFYTVGDSNVKRYGLNTQDATSDVYEPSTAELEKLIRRTAGWTNCPPKCSCDMNIQTVTCNSVPSIPAAIPQNVKRLNLSKCGVQHPLDLTRAKLDNSSKGLVVLTNVTEQYQYNTTINLHGLKNLRNLQTLDISCNNLTHLDHTILPTDLTHLYLNSNAIAILNIRSLLTVLPNLERLDVSRNSVRYLGLTNRLQDNFTQRHNGTTTRMEQVDSLTNNKKLTSLLSLLASGNQINRLDFASLALCLPSLTYLDLSANNIDTIVPLSETTLFANRSQLTHLNIANNKITNLPSNTFQGLKNLREIQLSGNQVSFLHDNAFIGLNQLQILNLSHNVLLETIHGRTFSHLEHLVTLDLTNCKLHTIYEPLFNGLHCDIRLQSNPWHCDCNLQWLSAHSGWSIDHPMCVTPQHLHGYSLQRVPDHNCTQPMISSYSQGALVQLGSSITLNCVAVGNPTPALSWQTPNNEVFHYDVAYVDYESEDMHHVGQYVTGRALTSMTERTYLLPNGSLHIPDMQRRDAGVYTCSVTSKYGNGSVEMEVGVQYTCAIFRTVFWTHIVGLCAASSFLLFGILIGIIRNITSWFQIKHQEDTNRKFKAMLNSLSDYKSIQIDRLSAYKALQIGKLSAFKNSKLDKFHSFSRPSLGSAIHHMQSMREHYSAQIDVIKDNCTEKTERLRENYTLRLQRFRDYKSDKVGKLRGYKAEKIERLRENYTHQAQKIRDYGSHQMAKLRSSYKLQQHYLIKLYELLDVGKCMTVIEAECMRTESMLFDESFITLDLETHPVHIDIHLTDSDNDDDSYYVTASSQSDVSVVNMLCSTQSDDVIKDESLGESVSDDLGQDDINFNDLNIQPYPPYLNFLEAIEIDSKKAMKSERSHKQRKHKKSKQSSKPHPDLTRQAHSDSIRRSARKASRRRALVKQAQGSDSDSDTDRAPLSKSDSERRTSPRKPRTPAKLCHNQDTLSQNTTSALKKPAHSSYKPTNASLKPAYSFYKPANLSDKPANSCHKPTKPIEKATGSSIQESLEPQTETLSFGHYHTTTSLHPVILHVENLCADDDAQSSVYESAHTSREQTPKLSEKCTSKTSNSLAEQYTPQRPSMTENMQSYDWDNNGQPRDRSVAELNKERPDQYMQHSQLYLQRSEAKSHSNQETIV